MNETDSGEASVGRTGVGRRRRMRKPMTAIAKGK